MNPLLLIPDGVGVRNFVIGRFLQQASGLGRTHALHAIPDHQLSIFRDESNRDVSWHSLLPQSDRPLSFVLRQCLSYAQMYWVDSFPMRRNRQRPIKGSWRTQIALRTARLIGRAASYPRGIQFLDRLHALAASRQPEVEHYRRLFREIKPSVLFCSHQRPPNILAPVLAAHSLGIPTATFIFSWDNLSSKGRIAAPFDHFLVWSDHMQRELLHFYPDVTADRVHVVGTPQFDPYGDAGLLWSREEFCRQIGGDAQRQLICYSGGDVGNSPEDPQHLTTLLEQIRAGRIRNNPQVLLRPCPVDDGSRYAPVRAAFPELIHAQPAWIHKQHGDWSQVMPSPEDVRFLANLTYHADLNVNFGSTMTLDFAIRDKPVVNVVFDVSRPPVYGMPMWEYLRQYEHYRPVIDLGAARMARSPDELAEHVNAYLTDPKLDQDNRRQFVDLEVGAPVGDAGRRILETLAKISR